MKMSKHILEEIDEDIRLMKERLESGQGDRTSAMCRLSLTTTESLRAMVDRFEQALLFYADPDTYFGISLFSLSDVLEGKTDGEKMAVVPDRPCGEFAEDFSMCGDRMRPGMLARQTLELGCFILNNQDIEDDE